ncbi:MAG: serine hydrolase domain-containing protein [Acidobacteriota bacterium]
MSLEKTRAAFHHGIQQGWHSGGQLYVSHQGQPVADLALGDIGPQGRALTVDDRMIWLSSTKPIAAVAIALLWEQGELDLDDPIVRFLPAFGQHGKDRITLRHVLTHTGGIRLLNLGWPKATWEETIEQVCRMRPEPRWIPGQKAGYHLASSWFILGAVIEAIRGESFSAAIEQSIFQPLEMNRCSIGLSSEQFASISDSIVPMHNTEGEAPRPYPWHKEPWVTRPNPGANGLGPLRELGRFYDMLLRRGRLADGRAQLSPQSVEALTTPHRVGLFDYTFQFPLDWGLGFIINSRHQAPEDSEADEVVPYGYGPHASRRTFGHSGRRSSTAFADPEHRLVVAFALNGTPSEEDHRRRIAELTAAIYQDLELAPSS